MAKGFTVKANAPKTKKVEDDFNLEEAKALAKGKAIVFCLPGRGVSYIFLKNFVQLCFDLVQNGSSIQISQDYSSMVNFARCKCLGANVLRGPDQIPWDGKLKYDCGLTLISSLIQRSSTVWFGCRSRLQAVGTAQRMERPLQWHIGWKKRTLPRMVGS